MSEKEIWDAIDKLRDYDVELTKCLNHMKGRLDIIVRISGITLTLIVGFIIKMVIS